MALDQDSGFSVLVARHDPEFGKSSRRRERWLLKTSPVPQVSAAAKPLIIADAQESPAYPGYQREARERGYRTVVLLPLHARDDRGRAMVMSIHARQQVAVDGDELAFLETAAALASMAVDKTHRLMREQQQAARLRRALEVHAASMEHVLAGRSLGSVVDLITQALPYPMLIVDLTTNQVTAHRSPAPKTIADAEWVQHMKRNGARGLGRLLRSAEPTHFSMRRSVNFAEIGIELETEALVEPFIVDGLVLGGMILFTGERELDPFDALVAEEARFTLAVLLMRAHVRFSAQAETHGEFFGRLFSGNWRDRTETLARAGHLGIPLDQPARLLILAAADGSGTGPSEAVNADVQRALQRIAARQQAGATAFVDGGAFVVFLPEPPGSDKVMKRTVQRLLDQVEWITGGRPIATIGRLCSSLEDYRTARQDGGRLLDLARRLDRRGLVTEEDIGPFARLLAAADQSALRSFIADIPIEAYDEKHGSGFLETVDVFLSKSCRYSATADALGIHITTLRYRLGRLGELFRIDFSDAEARLALEVALRLRTVVGSEMISAKTTG